MTVTVLSVGRSVTDVTRRGTDAADVGQVADASVGRSVGQSQMSRGAEQLVMRRSVGRSVGQSQMLCGDPLLDNVPETTLKNSENEYSYMHCVRPLRTSMCFWRSVHCG